MLSQVYGKKKRDSRNTGQQLQKKNKNAIVECIDYQIPLIQLKGAKGKSIYASSKERL